LEGLTCDFAGVFEGLILWWGESGLARSKAMSQKRDPLRQAQGRLFGKLRAGYGAPDFEAVFESEPPAIGRGSRMCDLPASGLRGAWGRLWGGGSGRVSRDAHISKARCGQSGPDAPNLSNGTELRRVHRDHATLEQGMAINVLRQICPGAFITDLLFCSLC
jgi:hypothetical protein